MPSPDHELPSLPVLPAPPPVERADAARNRRRILDVAEHLFTERGVEATTMDDIAAAAGVGKGTLYRRFGDRAGLGEAVLDERERVIQEEILRGPPPLGPGAPAAERLTAFIDALIAYVHRDLELIVMSETATPGARYRSGVYDSWHQHVATLLLEIDGDLDAAVLADMLLAPLAGDLQRWFVEDRGIGADRIAAGLRRLLGGLIAA